MCRVVLLLIKPVVSRCRRRRGFVRSLMPELCRRCRPYGLITREGSKLVPRVFSLFNGTCPTSSPSSKYEHRRTSALLRNIRNIRICMGKKPIVSVTYENERISIQNSLPYLKCVLRLSCVVHGPIYGRFMGFYVKSAHGPHRRDVTHILTKVSCFLLKPFHFRRLQKR